MNTYCFPLQSIHFLLSIPFVVMPINQAKSRPIPLRLNFISCFFTLCVIEPAQ